MAEANGGAAEGRKMNIGYTQVEWLQIGLLLIGMPISALIGSLVGLARRWNRGQVVTGAIIGLGGAAFASAVLFVAFLWFFTQTSSARGDALFNYFERNYGPQVTWMPMLCAALISALAGIGLRDRPMDRGKAALSFSMRQLLLLQLFAFATLGCWTGLRMAAASGLSTIERAERNWANETWQLQRDRTGEPRGIVGRLDPILEGRGEENRRFNKAIRELWLRELHLADIAAPAKLDFEKLKIAGVLELISLQFTSTAPIDQALIDSLGSVSSLRQIYLAGGEFAEVDFTPLANLKSLETLEIADASIGAASLTTLEPCRSIEVLGISECEIRGARTLKGLPIGIQNFGMSREKGKPYPRLFGIDALKSLRTIWINGGKLSGEEIKLLALHPSLEQVNLDCQAEVEDYLAFGEATTVTQLEIVERLSHKDRPSFRETMYQVAMSPSLKRFTFNYDCMLPPTPGEWDAGPWKDITVIEKREQEVTQEINERRAQKGLPQIKIRLSASNMTPPPRTPVGQGQGS